MCRLLEFFVSSYRPQSLRCARGVPGLGSVNGPCRSNRHRQEREQTRRDRHLSPDCQRWLYRAAARRLSACSLEGSELMRDKARRHRAHRRQGFHSADSSAGRSNPAPHEVRVGRLCVRLVKPSPQESARPSYDVTRTSRGLRRPHGRRSRGTACRGWC